MRYNIRVDSTSPPRLGWLDFILIAGIFTAIAAFDWRSATGGDLGPVLVLNVVAIAASWAWVSVRSDRIKRWWKSTRHRRALCEHCGYDLRGNVTDACPECGYWRPEDPDRISERLEAMTRQTPDSIAGPPPAEAELSPEQRANLGATKEIP
jgi:hypothetical protein